MKTAHGKIDGNLFLDYQMVLHGMVTGDIVVNKDGILYLHGMCSKNLIIQDGGKVYLFGMVLGNVQNRNGYLEVYGIIKGRLMTENGETVVDKKAIVGG